jgi:hypothetical protein
VHHRRLATAYCGDGPTGAVRPGLGATVETYALGSARLENGSGCHRSRFDIYQETVLMNELHTIVATLSLLTGIFMLRLAWRLHRGDFQDHRYPTRRHALMGRAADRKGRTGWLVYDERAHRLEGAVACPMRSLEMRSSVQPNGATDAKDR